MNWSLIIRTAVRDSRKDRSKLMLFMSSIILGVAALVAINSFNDNLVNDINLQAKSLLGADLTATNNKPISPEVLAMLDSLEGEVSTEAELFSMALFPANGQSQFVRIKAVEGGFPYYGTMLTEPASAALSYKDEPAALVDDGLMIQQGLKVGDSIKLGEKIFPITGRLMTAFGSIGVGSSFAPPVYIGKAYLAATDLVQPGSLVNYAQYHKVTSDIDLDAWEDSRREVLRRSSVRVTTVEDQKSNLEQAFSSLNTFLNLVALISLLLACIGVASSVLIYVKGKVSSIAILRCLGMQGQEAFLVYFLQIFVLGTIGVLLGVALGSVIQLVLPIVLKGFLPYEVNMSLSPSAMLSGFVVGTVITMLFALGPLLAVRKVSPLQTLRVSDATNSRDVWQWLVYGGIVLTIFAFLWQLTGYASDAAISTAGLAAAFAVLYAVAQLVTWAARRFFPSGAPFVVRQGIANLYRPNNQTRTLIVSIGLGTAILTVLFVLQGLILSNVTSMGAGNQPNMILYGIERAQKQPLEELTKTYDMPVLQHVPVVTMDLAAWKGKTKKEWLTDSTRTASRWAINREARVSYRAEMNPDDKLIEGTYTGVHDGGDSIKISLDERYANGLDVAIGDQLVWNVQGAMITTYVGSIRKINFRKMESRFFILFPAGVLEQAPQFMILVTKSPDKQVTADYRNAVVKAMPNVSVIDLGSILVTLNDIVTKVSYVIKFMAAFSILIGLIVLISSLFLSKYQRIRESVLLRTLGAEARQIFRINAVEYAALGVLSALTGIVLAVIGSYLLARFAFELDFAISWWPVLGIFVFIVALTVAIGLWNSREVVQSSPLDILRRV